MRILVIEDNKDLCNSICYHLNKDGYVTDACYSGEDAMFYATANSYDVIILDRMLPVLDGLSILKKLRKERILTPVIVVTAMDAINDRIDGLDAGADDYLVKPFAIEELLARVRALSRRPQTILSEKNLQYENITLEIKARKLSTSETCCTLSERESILLEFFLRHPEQLLSRESIITHVWGPDAFIEEGNLDNYIHFLRRHLSLVKAEAKIKTLHGFGYEIVKD